METMLREASVSWGASGAAARAQTRRVATPPAERGAMRFKECVGPVATGCDRGRCGLAWCVAAAGAATAATPVLQSRGSQQGRCCAALPRGVGCDSRRRCKGVPGARAGGRRARGGRTWRGRSIPDSSAAQLAGGPVRARRARAAPHWTLRTRQPTASCRKHARGCAACGVSRRRNALSHPFTAIVEHARASLTRLHAIAPVSVTSTADTVCSRAGCFVCRGALTVVASSTPRSSRRIPWNPPRARVGTRAAQVAFCSYDISVTARVWHLRTPSRCAPNRRARSRS